MAPSPWPGIPGRLKCLTLHRYRVVLVVFVFLALRFTIRLESAVRRMLRCTVRFA
jgi:hypothetical protein